jgi:hypothetical protein
VQDILRLLNNSPVVKNYEILAFEQEGNVYFFKCKIYLRDNTQLFVLESFRDNIFFYSYHWQDHNKKLIIRWDNAPHHKELKNFPNHLHDPLVQPSDIMHLEEVLKFIEEKIKKGSNPS